MKHHTEILSELSGAYSGLLAFTAVVCVILIWLYRWLQPKPLHGVPHNPIRGILGDIPSIMQMMKKGDKTIYDYYTHQVEKLGPISQTFVGRRVVLVLADQTEAEHLLSRVKSVDTPLYLAKIFGRLLPTAQFSLLADSTWRRHRRVLGPSMHQRYLSRMVARASLVAEKLADVWEAKRMIARDNAFRADVDLRLATMDLSATISLGSPLGCLDTTLDSMSANDSTQPGVVDIISEEITPMYQAIRTLMDHLSLGPTLPFPSVTFPVYLWFSRSWHKSLELLRTCATSIIDSARERETLCSDSEGLKSDADSVLDMLVQHERYQGSIELQRGEWFDELMLFFVAGQEPTGSTLSWFIKYIATDDDIQRRLHEEVCCAFSCGLELSSSTALDVLNGLDKMPLLEAVVAETLRCAMPGGMVVRQLLADEIIMGRPVPSGTELLIPNGLFGMKKSHWGPDVQTWRPDRWLRLDGSFDRNAGPTGNPFGFGHRACFGQKLAMMQLKVFIATMSRRFVFKPVPMSVDSWEANVTVTRQPKQCYVRLEQWN